MSLLNRLKFFPLKQLYPSISSSARISAANVNPLRTGQAIRSVVTKVSPRELYLSRFKDKAAALKKYVKLSAEEKKAYSAKAVKENAKRKERAALVNAKKKERAAKEIAKRKERTAKEIAKRKERAAKEKVRAAKENAKRKVRAVFLKERAAKESATFEKKKIKDLASNLVKEATHPYLLFIQANKGKYKSGKSLTDVSAALAREWTNMPDSQKQRYQREGVENRKQNKENFSKWAKTLSEGERDLLSRKGEKYLTKAQRSALSTRGPAPYTNFMREAYSSKKFSNTEDREAHKRDFAKFSKEISQKWKALSPVQRQAYA